MITEIFDHNAVFMEQFEKVNQSLEEQLAFIAQETLSAVKQAELSVPVCIKALDALKKLVQKQGFKSEKNEIFFFKYLKPKIACKLIYHIQVFNIETGRPSGTKKQQKKYFEKHLKAINRFTENNIDLCQYYRSDSTFLDEKYFVRGKADLHLILDSNFFNFDSTFNTSHDHLVAQILANDMLSLYIREAITNIDARLNEPEQNQQNRLTWTDSKAHLVELIYALHATGSFENGRADIKEIASSIQKAFNIDLGNYYHVYLEIRNRKTNRTKFLSLLQESLSKRMDEMDEK
ncbi:MAG: RteC domain-containing protein [Bacteroidetes bacterium]|nr:RteC domain-containing protein [Bacteroidota bacterium]